MKIYLKIYNRAFLNNSNNNKSRKNIEIEKKNLWIDYIYFYSKWNYDSLKFINKSSPFGDGKKSLENLYISKERLSTIRREASVSYLGRLSSNLS